MRPLDPRFPFDPQKSPVFYGWIIVVISTVGVIASIPGQTMGVSAFTEDLLATLEIDRIQLSVAYLGGTALSGFILPIAGRWVDRFGTRLMIILSSLLMGIVLLAMSQLRATDSIYLTIAILMVSFLFLRFSGQGMITMTSRTVLARWFQRRRGLASAISGIGIAAGFGIAPNYLNVLVQHFGWSGAWQILGITIGCGMALLGYLFFRERPEDCGLIPDGSLHHHNGSNGQTAEVTEINFTRREAIRTTAFWAVTLAISAHGLVITGVSFFIADIAKYAGIDRTTAFDFFVPLTLIGTVVGFSAGRACDYVPTRYLVFTMMLASICGGLGMLWFHSQLGFSLAAIGYGISGGFFGPLSSVALANYFGRKHLGAINGVMMSSIVISSALGPLWLAIPEALGMGYGPGLWAFLVLPVIVCGLALMTRPPQKPPNAE